MSDEVIIDPVVAVVAVEPVVATEPAVEPAVVVDDPAEPVDEPKVKTVPLPRFLQVNGEKNTLKTEVTAKDAEIDRLKKLLEGNPAVNQEARLPTKEELKQELFIETESTRILNAGNKAFTEKGFAEILQTIGTIGPVSNQLVEIMADVGDGEKILQYLSENLDDAEKILTASPRKQAIEITKLHAKITAPPKRTVSNAPAPVTPIGGSTKFTGIDINDKTIPAAERIREMKRLESLEREKKAGKR